ncbi:MAG: glycosyltransferase [Candidatus Omnitrophica bacterium]|nr:glycosyltransferase [Candidatus Omnitrophota bacterium]
MDASVVVICYNEADNIEACLRSLINQTYPRNAFEVIVVDGESKDNTQSIVRKYAAAHSNIRLIVEPKKGAAAARNTGLRSAGYGQVAFIDADCEAPSEWLEKLVKEYKDRSRDDNKLAAVGGKNIPLKEAGPFLKAIGVALDSFAGSFGSVQGRQFKRSRYVVSLATLNVLYDRKTLIDIGGYDESLESEAEDADLNFRLASAGYTLFFIPESFVWHKMRPTPKKWFKNMFRYGKGRARLLKRYPKMWRVSFVLPLLFISAMFSIIFIPFSPIFCLPLFYFPAVAGFSLFQAIRKKTHFLVFYVMLVYIIQHFGYSLGESYGLVNRNVK